MKVPKSLLVYLFSFFILLTWAELFLTSCASRASPTGGPADTTAPALDTSFPPNYSLFFDAKEIELVFDEYISLKSAQQQIMVSPPLKHKLDIQPTKRGVIIGIEDTLLENTTYTVSFGNSITDFTAGNANEKFKYVFSTGSFIDSLAVAGSISNSITNEAEKEMMVALYDINTLERNDSIAYHTLPTYYSYTDELGNFELQNLKDSKFLLVAFKDADGDFYLNKARDLTAYTLDTIEPVSSPTIKLVSFKGVPSYRFYSARHKGKGKIQFAFSRPVPDIKIRRLEQNLSAKKKPFEYLDFAPEKDTLIYWFEDDGLDSIKFHVSGYPGINDTSKVIIREFDPEALELSTGVTQVGLNDTVEVKVNLPIARYYAQKVTAFGANDTSDVFIGQKPEHIKSLFIHPTKNIGSYSLYFPDSTVRDLFDSYNDSTLFKVTNLGKDDLGNLDFNISGDSLVQYVLKLRNARGEIVAEELFIGTTTLKLRNYPPGQFQAEMIIDRNQDGEWTTGDYLEGTQPERIVRYPEEIEIRANWDLEFDWIIKPPKP